MPRKGGGGGSKSIEHELNLKVTAKSTETIKFGIRRGPKDGNWHENAQKRHIVEIGPKKRSGDEPQNDS